MIGWWAELPDLIPEGAMLTLSTGTPGIHVSQHRFVTPQGADLALAGGTPFVGGDYTAIPEGANLTITMGTPGVQATLLQSPLGANLAITMGTPDIDLTDNHLLTPAGADLPLTGGAPVVDILPPPPPQFVSANGAMGNSIGSMPSHQSGDLLIMIAVNVEFVPTVPDGWTTIGTASGSAFHSVLAYKLASSDSETSGTWTGADAVLCAVYRASGAITVGDASGTARFAATMLFPSLTLENTSGASTVVMIGCDAWGSSSYPTSTSNGSPRRYLFNSSYDGAVYDLVGATAFTGDSARFLAAGAVWSSSWSLEITST